MRIKILKDVMASIDGKLVSLSEGDIIESKSPDLEKLITGHYAEMVKPAIKVKHKPDEVKASIK